MNQFLLNANKGLEHGISFQSVNWFLDLNSITISNLKDYLTEISIQDFDKRIEILQKLLRVSSDSGKILLNYALCQAYFKRAISIVNDSQNVQKSLSVIEECNFYYEECNKAHREFSTILSLLKIKNENDNTMIELEELKQDFTLQKNILKGLQSKGIAQNLFRKCLELETLNFDTIWEIIDWYRDSIIKARGQDVECEAEVSSELGYIYEKVLKNKEKAKSYYQSSWHLADSLRPKLFNRYKWYQRCSEAIQRYQKEVVEEEERQKEKEYAKIKNEIQLDLSKINAKSDVYKFLDFIYKDYPPKNNNQKLPDLVTPENLSKVIQKAISHYHPDKNLKDDHGAAWFFISDAITKRLTFFYEILKRTD